MQLTIIKKNAEHKPIIRRRFSIFFFLCNSIAHSCQLFNLYTCSVDKRLIRLHRNDNIFLL